MKEMKLQAGECSGIELFRIFQIVAPLLLVTIAFLNEWTIHEREFGWNQLFFRWARSNKQTIKTRFIRVGLHELHQSILQKVSFAKI